MNITPGMVCEVSRTTICQTFAEEALDAGLDPIRHHTGSMTLYSGDAFTVLALVESTALVRASGLLVGVWTKFLRPSTVIPA